MATALGLPTRQLLVPAPYLAQARDSGMLLMWLHLNPKSAPSVMMMMMMMMRAWFPVNATQAGLPPLLHGKSA